MQCGQSAALGASLGVGPAPKVVCRNKSVIPPLSPFLLGKPSAWLIPVCYSSTPLPGRIPSEVFRAAGMRSFGPLAQTASVITVLLAGIRLRPELALPAADCAVRPHQRRSVVLLFGGQCLFAKTVLPRISVISRSLL